MDAAGAWSAESGPRAVTGATHFNEARIADRFIEADVREGEKENKMKPYWGNVMTKLYAVAAFAFMLMGATLNAPPAAPAPPAGLNNIILGDGPLPAASRLERRHKILVD